MRLVRSYPVVAFALVLLSIVGFCVAQGSVGLLLTAGALAAMSWYVTEGPRGRSLPKWTANILIIAASLNVFVDLVQHNDDVMGVLGRFTVWLTLIKLYERKSPRDHAHLLALSLLLMITGCLISADLLFGIVLLLYAVLGIYVVVLFQLHAAYERAKAVRSESVPRDYRLAPPLRPIIGRSVVLHFRSLVAGIALAGLALSIAVFMITPRGIGSGLITGAPRPHDTARTAFVPEVDLTTGTRITESRRAVLTVQVLDSRDRPIHLEQPLRLRGAVLPRYDPPGRWRTGERPIDVIAPVEIEPGGAGFEPLGAQRVQTGLTYTLAVHPVESGPAVFAPYAPVALLAEKGHRFEFDPETLLIRRLSSFHLDQYEVKVQPAPGDTTLRSLARHTPPPPALPPSAQFADLRVRELATELLSSASPRLSDEAPTNPEARWRWCRDAARVFAEHLQTGAFTYVTDMSDVLAIDADQDEVDPIVRFLFETRRGHCEYFASALAAMCHTKGIEARLVTGYLATEYDDSARQYLVRESNAHAWVEVRTGPHRWTTIDPSPPDTLREIHQSHSTLTDRLRWIYDRFESGWTSRIITFDRDTQARLAESMNLAWGDRFTRLFDTIQDWMMRVNYWFKLGPAGYIWMGIVGLALVIAVMALIKLMRRSRRVRRTLHLEHLRGAEYRRLLKQLGFYLDMLAELSRGGEPKPAWQPPLSFADRLGRRRPAAAGVVREATAIFYDARYGRRPLNEARLARARTLVDELPSTLKSAT